MEVIVEALAKVTIRYSFNEGKWETLSLNTDQVHTFRSRSPIKFEFTDGGAVNVIVNGKDIGTPGTKQKPINISFPWEIYFGEKIQSNMGDYTRN